MKIAGGDTQRGRPIDVEEIRLVNSAAGEGHVVCLTVDGVCLHLTRNDCRNLIELLTAHTKDDVQTRFIDEVY